MLHVSDTAYPRLKAHPTSRELEAGFTPTLAELAFAEQQTRRPASHIALLVFLKTFQRLGYFVQLTAVPAAVLQHVAQAAGFLYPPEGLLDYDRGTARARHLTLVRTYVNVTAFDATGRKVIVKACVGAARVRDDLVDIINAAIEELVRQRYELPAFGTLLRCARHARATVNQGYYAQIAQSLTAATRERLQALLARQPEERHTPWERVKTEPQRPTTPHMRAFLHHLQWLRAQSAGSDVFADVPDVKVRQFAAEARALNAAAMQALQPTKRLTLAAALVQRQVARALDDVAEMFIRRVQRMHAKAKDALQRYQAEDAHHIDALIALLRETVLACHGDGTRDERFAAVEALLRPNAEEIVARCEAHAAIAGHNHAPFLLRFYQSQRAVFMSFLEHIPLTSTSQDQTVEHAIAFLVTQKTSRSPTLPMVQSEQRLDGAWQQRSVLDLSFVSDTWWPLVTGRTVRSVPPTHVDRRYFEVCLISHVMQELKSGDLCIPGSTTFNDYRTEFVSWDDYHREIATYGEQAGIPIERAAFITQLRTQLETAAQQAEAGFPTNTHLRLEHDRPVLKRLRARPKGENVRRFTRLLKERMPPVGILDTLVDTEHWLNWTQHFGPLSGHEAKLDKPRERYLATAFCYGCNLGPTQTARAMRGLDRRQLAFVNQRHVTEEKLDEAIVTVINAYARCGLPKLWGLGSSASADGTQWEIYPRNLMAEYHIRYGGYGGIGYYLIADSYIALFSRFITCGAWEGHHILDFVTENPSDVRPDTVHADTHGQSESIFGLAYLLGIQLMPRIRNWQDLHFYRPSRESRYEYLEALFTAQIDWDLIVTLLPDMLRVAVSVKLGRVAPSTILRRLGTYSRKNRLYVAFRELGRVVRTIFLLRYLSDPELRRMIHAATNKSEAFNKYAQWVLFGGDSVITEGIRDEQRKIIKYNHLLANLLIFHTLVTMTHAIRHLVDDGYPIDTEALATLSPYQTEHINRFGTYILNLQRTPPPLDLEFWMPAP
jgi:TnpA family transposase